MLFFDMLISLPLSPLPLSLFHNFFIILIDSVVRSSLMSADGQSNPTETSFIASPVPIPNPIRPGYITSKEANACAIIPGLYRYAAAVTPVMNFIFFVLSAAAASQTHVKLPKPPLCDHG